MSLDVYLTIEGEIGLHIGTGIFAREDGQTKEISRAEWDKRHLDCEPVSLKDNVYETDVVYSANITHNLNKMADEGRFYEYLWRPEEVGIKKARQLIEPLQSAITAMEQYPGRFQQWNPENGWGTYEILLRFVHEYLAACKQYPEATVSVSR